MRKASAARPSKPLEVKAPKPNVKQADSGIRSETRSVERVNLGSAPKGGQSGPCHQRALDGARK